MNFTEIPDVHFKNTRALNVHNLGSASATVNLFIKEQGNGSLSAEVRRKDLLAALGAEPDESDYAEVLAENASLGAKLSKAVTERDGLAARNAELLERARAAEEASEDDPEEQDYLDRSWALEKAGEVLGGLAAVGALPKDYAGIPLVHLAEWILNGSEADDE